MTYTATQLITNAYYLSTICSRGFQTVTGEQLTDGLYLLNALLSFKSADQRLIPYFSEYPLTAVAGQEKYFVSGLIHAETLTFNIGNVRFSSEPVKRDAYFGSGRVDSVTSLPFTWHAERYMAGSNIFLYFLPASTYAIKIWGKFAFSDITIGQDLSLTYDKFYIEYLRYALADYICSEYQLSFPPQSAKKLAEMEKIVQDVSPPDLSMQKVTSFGGGSALNWADCNLGLGWRPY